MIKIINTSTLQRNIGQVLKAVQEKPHIVINKSEAKIVLLPYFEGCEDFIADYWRAINGHDLKRRYHESLKSSLSDLSV